MKPQSFREFIADGSESARRPSLPDVPLIEDRRHAPPLVTFDPIDDLEIPPPVDDAATFVGIDPATEGGDDTAAHRIDLTTEDGAREFVRRLYEEEDAIVEGPKARTASIALWLGVAALVVLGAAFALTMLARVAH